MLRHCRPTAKTDGIEASCLPYGIVNAFGPNVTTVGVAAGHRSAHSTTAFGVSPSMAAWISSNDRTRPRRNQSEAIAPARAEVDSCCMMSDDFKPAFTRSTSSTSTPSFELAEFRRHDVERFLGPLRPRAGVAEHRAAVLNVSCVANTE